MGHNQKKIALFIPCFNEARRLKITPVKDFIEVNKKEIDFYFIDDGSNDATSEIISQNFVNENNSFLLKLDKNLGKGNAIRSGMLQMKNKAYKYYGFIDADLDIPMKQVRKLYEHMEGTSLLMAVSSRNLFSDFKITRPRSLSSLAMVMIANRIIRVNPRIKDTQCGCKLIRREILEVCFQEEFISEWLFDVELFLRMKMNMPNARKFIGEVPLNDLNKTSTSNFKFRNNLRIVKQLYLIKSSYK